MQDTYWTWKKPSGFLLPFLAALALALTGCAADGASEAAKSGHTDTETEVRPGDNSKETIQSVSEELSFRPLCSKCATICSPLRGYFRDICSRSCNKACVNPCEACKDNCKLLQGSQKTACLNTCAASAACRGPAKCGNGRIEGAEMCDDGNTTSGDGCSKTCQIEPPVCGNGRLESPEQCDDGNLVDGDGCSKTCQIVAVCRCGDGVICAGEECDDGNTVNSDSCTNVCKLPKCGDAIVQVPEQCDDGNTNNNDGCQSNCRLCECGDGIICANEQCDDGNNVSGDGCTPSCIREFCGDGVKNGTEECDDANTTPNDGCLSCKLEKCGDGIKQTNEACDDGNTVDNDVCSNACVINPACGNGVLDATEECDDNNAAANDGCFACKIEKCGDGVQQTAEQCDDGNTVNDDTCTNGCKTPKCGDSIVQLPETCDDGNVVSFDGCSASCKAEGCGDGVRQPNEDCDDGNKVSNDGCSASCVREFCGDAIKQAAEQCDDGNTAPNDGCSALCKIERCGDGVLQTGEACEDGNTVGTDTCDLTCAIPGPSCTACRNSACRNFLGVDLVRGCFEAVQGEYGANPSDPAFIQDCVNLVSCAQTNHCGFNDSGVAQCYCGSANFDDCAATGPAADAPCVPQVLAASRATTNIDVQNRFVDLVYPTGWANFLMQCEGTSCNSKAVGDCTAPTAVRSSKPAYLVPVAPGVTTQAILTTGDSPNAKPNSLSPYRMVGIPDGLGAFDNNDGTFTLLSNHELGNTIGVARAHGGIGAFVSRWTINKSDLGVLHGEDLMKNVQSWNTATSSYTAATGAALAFGRFCSADLPAPSAFYDSASGLGFNGRLFMNGEESGNEGRAMAHGLNGTSWELPRLGKASWENLVANPVAQQKTIVIGMDDTSPAGQVYVYVGTKTNSGLPVDMAGLTNGTLYGVSVPGVATEPSATGIPAGSFALANLGNVEALTGAVLDTNSTTANVTKFLRPEDGSWDPAHPNDFYFVTTNAITAPSRLWRLRFSNIAQPELGGSIEMMLDGTEGQLMLDNMSIDSRGHIMLLEDVGNNAHIGQIFRYDIATDKLTNIAQHDPALFTSGSPTFITADEEASGIIDATAILGAGWWLVDVQAHNVVGGELAEGGQYVAIFDPASL